MSERLLLAIAGVLVAALLGLAFLWQPSGEVQRRMPEPAMPTGGDFTLQSADGPVSLDTFRGRTVLLYFGYTFCPDICPTSLNVIADALKQLQPDERRKVTVIFVSVDPARDTPQHLKQYVQFFAPEMLGVTGSAEGIADVARRYGVFYAAQKRGEGNAYAVDHSSETYVIGGDGKLKERLAHATPSAALAAVLRKYLNQP